MAMVPRWRTALGAVTALLAIAATTGSAGGAAPPVGFSFPYDVEVGGRPDSVVVADFDLDGDQDLAAANLNAGTISIRLGDGAGGFRPAPDLSMFVEGLAVGDFNRDGRPDLAGGNPSGGVVGVWLGDGTGGFSAPAGYPTGGDWPRFPRVADVDGDGDEDLVVPLVRSHHVSVLLGDGAGEFSEPRLTDVHLPVDLAVGDVDGDGHVDVAVNGFVDAPEVVLFGDGTGAFPDRRELSGGVSAALVGDLDGDGRADVAFGDRLFRSLGARSFADPVSLPVGDWFHALAPGDFNGDGRPDLAAATGSDTVAFMVNEGGGTFSAGPVFPTARSPVDAAVGDFNGDGRQDVAVATLNGCCVHVLLNRTGLEPPYRDVVLGDGPRGFWRFGDTSGKTAADEVGPTSVGGDPGTYAGGVVLGRPGAVAGDTAIELDGRTGSVTVPDSFGMRTGDHFTAELWIKRRGPVARRNQGLVLKGFQLFLDAYGRLVLRRTNHSTIARSTVRLLDTSDWHHVVATKAGRVVRLYLDGADVTGRVTNRTVTDTAAPLRWGTGAGHFAGLIDEAALYGHALTPEQVRAHFEAGRG